MWPFTRKNQFDDLKAGHDVADPTPVVELVEAAPAPSAAAPYPARHSYFTGDKFQGGFGTTDVLTADYWTLRTRSSQLFKSNLYARGIIRRMVTNEINVGLHLEAMPEESILGFQQDGLSPWSEDVENRFNLWADSPALCDFNRRQTFGELQATARAESLIEGDVLWTQTQDPITKLPRIRIICGSAVQTPFGVQPAPGNRIVEGVELDPNGNHVAFWVRQLKPGSDWELEHKRLPAYGAKTGRKIAWLVYGTDKRHSEVRGEPVLSLVLQSLKEIDRYRDSVQRKAVINSMIALFIKKTQDVKGTRPVAGGGISRRTEATVDAAGEERSFSVAEYIPGAVIDELAVGEEPHGFISHGTDEKFGDFEDAIVNAIAWAQEIPPEILRLSFNSNYSASQAAINEYKIYLNPVRTRFGNAVCKPVYQDWLLSQVLTGKVKAATLLEAWRDPLQYDTLAAWWHCDWAGNIKPAVDMSKLVRAYAEMIEEGFITRARATREITGMKFSKNAVILLLENELVAKFRKPLVELEASAKAPRAELPSAEELDEADDKESAKLHVLVA